MSFRPWRARAVLPAALSAVAMLAGCERTPDPIAPRALAPRSSPAAASASVGTAVDLGTLGGSDSQAMDVNDNGQVVGVASTPSGDQHAFLWQNGTMTDLGTLPGGSYSYATAINDRGQVVGMSMTASTDPAHPGFVYQHAFLWQNGTMTDLGTLPGGYYSVATDVNENGQVVGYAEAADGAYVGPRGFLWQNGTMRSLATLSDGSFSYAMYAMGINDSGTVVGYAESDRGVTHAIRWQNGSAADLDALSSGGDSYAFRINVAGQIAGTKGGPAIWDNGGVRNLAVPDGLSGVEARALNDRGLVVGISNSLAVVWRDGSASTIGGSLNASGANNAGQVIGSARTAAGDVHAMLWTLTTNAPPIANAGGAYATAEGSPLTFDGTASTDPDGDALTYAWDFGDGSSGSGATASHVYADNGAYTATLTVTDPKGASTVASARVTVTNAAPAPSLTLASATLNCFDDAVASGTFSDTGTRDQPWRYSLDFGDGSASVAGSTSTQSASLGARHLYDKTGTFPVTLSVTDKDGGVGTAKTTVTRTCAAQASSIASNFNGTAIDSASAVWFNSVAKVTGVPSTGATLRFRNARVQFTANGTAYDLPVPNAQIVFSPSATQATTSYDAATNTWNTTLPVSYTGNAWLAGLIFRGAALPGGVNPVTWTGTFTASAPGIGVNWQWAAAAYTQFGADYNALGVKAAEGNQLTPYANSDHAGTPEGFKAYVTGGARGGGGSNWTGGYSGTKSAAAGY